MKNDYTTNPHYLTYTFLFRGWENVLFELGSEMVMDVIRSGTSPCFVHYGAFLYFVCKVLPYFVTDQLGYLTGLPGLFMASISAAALRSVVIIN